MFYSAKTGGFYSEEVHGSKRVQVVDPKWVCPTTEVNGEQVPDETVKPRMIEIANPECKIPPSAVEITDTEYSGLLAAQSQGKVIQPDNQGKPIAADPPPPGIAEQILLLESTITPRRRDEAILGDDNGWLKNIRGQIAALRAELT